MSRAAAAPAVTLLACQIDIPFITTAAERDAHIGRVAETIDRALTTGGSVDLVVLPELSTLHYSRGCFDHLADLAEPLDDSPSLDRLAAVAKKHKTPVLAGLARRGNGAAVHISQVLIEADGIWRQCYDKMHIAQFGDSMEKDFFTPGEHLMVFDIRGFRFGTIICYDMRFPEMARALTRDHHIDVLLHPTAFTRDETFHTWHSFAATRAVENQVYFASVNRAGADFGESVLMTPWVDETAPPQVLGVNESLARWVQTRDAISHARGQYPFLRDVRADYTV